MWPPPHLARFIFFSRSHRWASQFSPFSRFANGQRPFVSLSTNGQTANLRLHDEQTVNGLRKIAWAYVLYVYIYKKGTNGKNGDFRVFAANGK